jgi:hypothetical protein
MKRKAINTTSFLGAVPQLVQFIDSHSAALTEKGVKPEDLKTKLNTCCASVQTTAQQQADNKTALKNATETHNDTVAQRYPEFSSVIDLLRGAVGNNTALGKQLTNIRKAATRRAGRSASNTVEVNPGAKKAA